MYQFENMSFQYKEKLFEHVSLTIPEKKIGIVGENGIGKTTLLKFMNGDLNPVTGKLEISEKTYFVNFALEKYKKFILSDLIRLCQCMNAFDCKKIDYYLEKLYITKYLDTMIGEMSKGTAKKVSLLLGFLTKDRILLVDEPFEALDEKSNQSMVELFSEWERPLVIVSHDRMLLKRSVEQVYEVVDRTICLNVEEEG